MASLESILRRQIPQLRDELNQIATENGDKVVSEVKLSQIFAGMRGALSLLCNTSRVDPDLGVIYRNVPILDLVDKDPIDIFYLLLIGELPSQEDSADLTNDLRERAAVPPSVEAVLRAMPKESHPMAMFSTAIMTMQNDSKFFSEYSAGNLKKTDHWQPMLEDALTIIARVPEIAAMVYRIRYSKGDLISYDSTLGWSQNFSHMTGLETDDGKLGDLMRLFFVLHADHGGGNASTFTCNVINSTLSDAYYAVSGGLNALAGPLHGLANQECLKFVLSIHDHFKGNSPSDDELNQFVWDRLNNGQVIPGYGHAVLRAIDPRFVAFNNFGNAHISHDPIFSLVDRLFNIVPGILKEHGKATNPWPNVDAASGSLLYHFGLKEFEYYTVLFSISRILGFLSQMILNRAAMNPIIRPKAVDLPALRKLL